MAVLARRSLQHACPGAGADGSCPLDRGSRRPSGALAARAARIRAAVQRGCFLSSTRTALSRADPGAQRSSRQQPRGAQLHMSAIPGKPDAAREQRPSAPGRPSAAPARPPRCGQASEWRAPWFQGERLTGERDGLPRGRHPVRRIAHDARVLHPGERLRLADDAGLRARPPCAAARPRRPSRARGRGPGRRCPSNPIRRSPSHPPLGTLITDELLKVDGIVRGQIDHARRTPSHPRGLADPPGLC